MSFPIDSTIDYRLDFANDSTVVISTKSRHMSRGMTQSFKYLTSDTAIDILPKFSTQDSSYLKPFGITYFFRPVIHLTKINEGLVDSDKSLIYIKENNLPKKNTYFYIDGKKFKQKIDKTSGYGVITKRDRTNQRLMRKLKKLNKDNFTMELVRGLNAYNRFGLKYIYGVIILTTKK